MDENIARVRRIIEELRLLERELNTALIEGTVDPEAEGAEVELEALKDLKSAVDQIRHFLWFYFRAVSGELESSEKTLRLLRRAAQKSLSAGPSNPVSFLEQLNAMADYALLHCRVPNNRKPN
jgi:hypothetical protein